MDSNSCRENLDFGRDRTEIRGTVIGILSLSSCEAEIAALSEAAKDTLYTRTILQEMGVTQQDPTALATDNKAAHDLSYNPEHHKRTKHVERRHFFIRECVEDMKLTVPLVKTTENLADFFTKPLAAKNFFNMRNAIMNIKGDHTEEQPALHSRRSSEP